MKNVEVGDYVIAKLDGETFNYRVIGKFKTFLWLWLETYDDYDGYDGTFIVRQTSSGFECVLAHERSDLRLITSLKYK